MTTKQNGVLILVLLTCFIMVHVPLDIAESRGDEATYKMCVYILCGIWGLISGIVFFEMLRSLGWLPKRRARGKDIEKESKP